MQWFLERGLGAPRDVTMFLGDRVREWAPYVRIESHALWMAEPLSRKVRAILRGRWEPSETTIQTKAVEAYRDSYFGGDDDAGDHLAILNDWHLRRDWNLDSLTESDSARAGALASFTVLTRLRYRGIAESSLNLRLARRTPYMTDLIYPMVAKTPLISLRYFLDLHVHYTFNAVRHANHPDGDDIVSFIYDLLFLQQKTAIALLEYVRLATYAEEHKVEAQLINAEVDAIMLADLLFAYLKASVEKTIALVGATHGIANLDAKKDHGKRVAALRSGLPAGIENLPYASFLFEMVGSENLEDLNRYRTGLLHKKGVADLQPHNYVGQPVRDGPLRRVFGVLQEQHARNTALLLVALAMLTDKLVQLDPPPFAMEDLPTQRKLKDLPKRFAAEEVALTQATQGAQAEHSTQMLAQLFAERGLVRRRLGQHPEAVADFREAITYGVERKADIFYEIGVASMDLEDLGKDAAAVDAFTSAIAIAPDMDKAYIGRAFAYEDLGDITSAVADLDIVIPRVEKPEQLLENRGLWRLALGRYSEALADFDAATAGGYETLDLLTARGVALRELGDMVAALSALTAAIDKYPGAIVARMHRATLLTALGDSTAARADLDRVIEQNANHYKASLAFSVRAVLRAQTDDRLGAIEDMQHAIARSEGPPPPEWLGFLREMGADQRTND